MDVQHHQPPLAYDMPRKLKPFQFRLRTLIVVTAVVAVLLAIGRFVEFEEVFGFAILVTFFIAIFLAPVVGAVLILINLCVPSMKGLEFGGWRTLTLVVCTGLHSVCMLMLATVAFSPDWKGAKGLHWAYYVLDAPAGLTLWPIYGIGAISFVTAVINPNYAVRSRLNFVMIVTLAAISAWYAIAALLLNFCWPPLAYVPAMVCVEYGLYAWLIRKHGAFEGRPPISFLTSIAAWLTAVLAAIGWKIPLAMRFYDSLPNSQPGGCFIVTAATRGHWWLVGTWRDESGRTVNRQLLTFKQLEAVLTAKAPRCHRMLRSIYNRMAPPMARCIVAAWMADVIYVLLKPVEWLAAVVIRRSDRR